MKVVNFEVFEEQQKAVVTYGNEFEEILIIADFHDCEDCFFYDGISGCTRDAFDMSISEMLCDCVSRRDEENII